MFSPLSLPRYATTSLALMLFASQGFCQKERPAIDPYLVTFVPPVTVHHEEHLHDCTGVILSPERIAMTSACVADARQLRRSGAVTVKNHQGEYIGQLPAIGDQPFDAIQTLLEPEREVPFVSGLKPDDVFPVFVDTDGLNNDELEAGNYYLRSFVAWKGENVYQHVQLQKLSSLRDKLGLLAGDSDLLKQLPLGSPVVDEQDRIMCLLGDDGKCESVVARATESDDHSCHIPYFSQGCGNETWSICEAGMGKGQCINEKSHEHCDVIVAPDMVDGDSLHCRNAEGCGGIVCPSNCATGSNDCDCSALWGFCEIKVRKAVTEPDGCIDQQGGMGDVDSRCHSLVPTSTLIPTSTASPSPDDFRHSPAFWPVVVGVPAAITVISVVAVAIVTGVACKYHRRSGYTEVK